MSPKGERIVNDYLHPSRSMITGKGEEEESQVKGEEGGCLGTMRSAKLILSLFGSLVSLSNRFTRCPWQPVEADLVSRDLVWGSYSSAGYRLPNIIFPTWYNPHICGAFVFWVALLHEIYSARIRSLFLLLQSLSFMVKYPLYERPFSFIENFFLRANYNLIVSLETI